MKERQNLPRQIRFQYILDYIAQYQKANRNLSPTMRELCHGVGMAESSYGTMYTYIKALESEGYVDWLYTRRIDILKSKYKG